MLPRSWITKDEDGATTLVVVRKEGSSIVVETTVQSSAKAKDKEKKEKTPEINLKENAKLPATKRLYLNPTSNKYISYTRAKQLGLI